MMIVEVVPFRFKPQAENSFMDRQTNKQTDERFIDTIHPLDELPKVKFHFPFVSPLSAFFSCCKNKKY